MDSYNSIIKQCIAILGLATLVCPVSIKMIAILIFTITAIIYFVLSHTCTLPLFGKMFVKCAPIFCLMWFVLLHKSSDKIRQNRSSKKIFLGLLFSSVGDVLLTLDHMFVQGMVAFGIAHLFYISALGFDDLKVRYGIVVYTLCALITPSLLPSSDHLLRCCIPFYSFLLSTMGWRSLTKLYYKGTTNWNRLLVGIGGVLWMVSDATLAYNKFNHPFLHANDIVMTTYYVGQLGIASSVMLEN
uniref:lysoplasmalogenase n=2 Tax=Lygus hesperus TaxID=30085 RepID=A0A0A9WQ47_LYGHE